MEHLINQLRKRNEGTQPPGASGSDTLNEPTPMEQDQEEVKLRKSERGRISRRRFEIEGGQVGSRTPWSKERYKGTRPLVGRGCETNSTKKRGIK